MRKFVVGLLVLAGLLVAADRVLVSAAESVVARRAQVAADLETRPKVEIRGFPFVTQAVRGVYDRIDVSLPTVERGEIRLEHLVVRLRDVHAPLAQMLREDGSVSVRADSARARVVVPYAVLERRLPAGVNLTARGGRLRLVGEVRVLGVRRDASALVDVHRAGTGFVFEATRVRVGGTPAPALLSDRLSFSIDVGELPFGLKMTRVEETRKGVAIAAVASDILLSGTP